MDPSTIDRLDDPVADAIAARRARRTPWQSAHVDRINREREARQTARDYRRGQRAAGGASSKHCNQCCELKPPSDFEALPSGNLRITCRDCRAAIRGDRRLEAQAARREEREAERSAEQAALRAAAEARRRKREEHKRRPVSPAQQREAAERIAHLTSLLMGTNPQERIDSEQGWTMATSELQRLWLQSGDKVCVSCKATVPPADMQPPGPASFYPGQCRRCAHTAWEASHRATYGPLIGPLSGPRKITMRDGTRITVADFARRVYERSNSIGTAVGS